MTIHHDLHAARLEIARLREEIKGLQIELALTRLLAKIYADDEGDEDDEDEEPTPPASGPRPAPAPDAPSAGRPEPGAAGADSRGPDRA